jgi:hypothetical protein
MIDFADRQEQRAMTDQAVENRKCLCLQRECSIVIEEISYGTIYNGAKTLVCFLLLRSARV